jgi:DNA polymerase-4
MAKFAKEIERDIGVSVSVGLSYCKFLAKVASDMDKPRGYFVIGEKEALDFLRTMPVSTIWGVGKSFEKTLRQDGITTVGQLQLIERAELVRRYGTMGDRLYHLSRGLDDRQVRFETEIKSVSSETTFNADLSTYEELLPILRALSEKVSSRLKKKGIAGHTIVLKLKTRDFTLRTRNRRLADSSRLADRIFRTGAELLKREIDGTSFRLIGIGVSDLTDESLADPPDLVDVTSLKWASAEAAIDAVREKFGTSALETGFTFGKGNRGTPQRDHDA